MSGARWEGDEGVGGEGVGSGGDEMNNQTHKLMTYLRNSVQLLGNLRNSVQVLSDLRDDKVPTTRRQDKCCQSCFKPKASLLECVYKPEAYIALTQFLSFLSDSITSHIGPSLYRQSYMSWDGLDKAPRTHPTSFTLLLHHRPLVDHRTPSQSYAYHSWPLIPQQGFLKSEGLFCISHF